MKGADNVDQDHIEPPQGPMIQIMPVENGYLITAYNGRTNVNNLSEASAVFTTLITSINKGEDPTAAFKKTLDQASLKESVRRKPVEHHVSKSVEETLKLVGEILGSMKQ